jgi:hypothetical protein
MRTSAHGIQFITGFEGFRSSHDFGRALAAGHVGTAITSLIEYRMPGTKFEEGLKHRREAEQRLARTHDKPALSRDQKLVAGWEAKLVRLRADVRKLGHWTPGRRALAKELEANIAHHSKGRH